MKRLALLVSGVLAVVLLFVPAAAAADESLPHTGQVLFSAGGDLTVPPGEHVDAVIVIDGTATVSGQVNTVVVIDGRAVLDGARTESIVAIGSPVDLLPGTVVSGDILKVESLVTRHGDAQLLGTQRDIASELAGVGFFLGPLFLLLFAGFALAAIAAGLLLAALASRQVRAAEAFISRSPGRTLLVGIAATVLPILVIALLFVTVVGAPLAFGVLFGLWPLTAFIGYLVAGIWIGDWLLRTRTGETRARPYLAAVIGIAILQVLAIWPFLSMIASLFGTGAVLRVAWQTLRSGPAPRPSMPLGAPAPQPG